MFIFSFYWINYSQFPHDNSQSTDFADQKITLVIQSLAFQPLLC